MARRRGGVHGAEHLPHDVHVAVLARPHLIPQLPQAGGSPEAEAGGEAEPDTLHRHRRPAKQARHDRRPYVASIALHSLLSSPFAGDVSRLSFSFSLGAREA